MQWTQNDISQAKYLGVFEFKDVRGEWQNFDVYETTEKLIFGGFTNTCFLESGFMEKDDFESTQEALQELLEELQQFYSKGTQYTNRIVFNERM